MDGIRFFAPKTFPCQSTEIPKKMHNTHASPTTLRVADDVESTIPGPATSSSNRYHHTLPEDYDDQVDHPEVHDEADVRPGRDDYAGYQAAGYHAADWRADHAPQTTDLARITRSEEHTSELQSPA